MPARAAGGLFEIAHFRDIPHIFHGRGFHPCVIEHTDASRRQSLMQENRHAVRSPNVLGQRVRGARLDVEREYALGSDGKDGA
jgi:hypothetical protein